MFEHLAKFRTIFVTGPQRSGTTIAARMIAHDLGYEYIDERDYGAHDLQMLFRVVEEQAVVQGPALSAYCHLLPRHVAVVLMRRALADIVASQDRTTLPSGKSWTDEEEIVELAKYFRPQGPIAGVKYEAWETVQKPAMTAQGKTFFEVLYEDLADHPLWVAKDLRKGWGPKQTAHDMPKRKKQRQRWAH